MPCRKENHPHHHNYFQWPTSGVLTIERCEQYCGFCPPATARKFTSGWFVRRHVHSVHISKGQFPHLTVNVGWTDRKNGFVKKSKKSPAKAQARHAAPLVETPVPVANPVPVLTSAYEPNEETPTVDFGQFLDPTSDFEAFFPTQPLVDDHLDFTPADLLSTPPGVSTLRAGLDAAMLDVCGINGFGPVEIAKVLQDYVDEFKALSLP